MKNTVTMESLIFMKADGLDRDKIIALAEEYRKTSARYDAFYLDTDSWLNFVVESAGLVKIESKEVHLGSYNCLPTRSES